jgi:arginine deiminase
MEMTWGFDSETGVLRDVLLCRPDYYTWLPLNSVARATLASTAELDLQAAQRQYREMEHALEEAGTALHYLKPDPVLQYQVYTRDSSQMTPWGVVITQMFRPQRRGEYAAVTEFYQAKGIPVWKHATAGSVEGGDIHVIRPGLLLIGYSGERTSEEGARQFAGWFAEQGWETRLYPFPEHFLHLDVLFSMVSDRLALACVDVLDDDLLDWLKAKKIELVPVSYKDSMQLGCNVLALGNDRVVSPAHNKAINARLRAQGITVLDPEFSLFTKGGGGVHCMTMPLRRDPA